MSMCTIYMYLIKQICDTSSRILNFVNLIFHLYNLDSIKKFNTKKAVTGNSWFQITIQINNKWLPEKDVPFKPSLNSEVSLVAELGAVQTRFLDL